MSALDESLNEFGQCLVGDRWYAKLAAARQEVALLRARAAVVERMEKWLGQPGADRWLDLITHENEAEWRVDLVVNCETTARYQGVSSASLESALSAALAAAGERP